jgi:ABC-type branched-subunit amino acid transport system substrate-binding protein
LAVVGWTSASGEQNETPYLTGQGIPIVGGLGTPSEFQSSISYPIFDPLTRFGQAMGTHATVDLGFKHPAIVVVNLNFISAVEQAIIDALHAHGVQEVSADQVPVTQAQYSQLVVKWRQKGADSVLAGLDPFSYARMYQGMEGQGFQVPVMGFGLDKTSAEGGYGSYFKGAQSLTPVLEPDEHTSNAAMAAYLNAVQTYYPNQVPALDVYCEGQWIAAEAFVKALRSIAGPITRGSLISALNAIQNWDTGLTKPITYGSASSHDPNHCFYWTKNQDGTAAGWHTYSDWVCF